jgi:3-hydroxyacyl-CoA dehydrogenase, NAD binding domain
MRVLVFRGIEFFAQNELIVLGLGGQAMHDNLTRVSVGIALTTAAVFHIASSSHSRPFWRELRAQGMTQSERMSMSVSTIGVIGAGVMGSGIAQVAATKGAPACVLGTVWGTASIRNLAV